MDIVEYGAGLEALGKLLQDPNSRMNDIVAKAHAIGLKISFGIEQEQVPERQEGI